MCRSVAAGTATACGCSLYRGCCAAAGTGADHPKGAHMNAVARLALRRAAHRAARERSYEETGRAARALARGQVAGCAARVTARQRNPRHGARGPCTHAEQALGSSSDCAQLRQPSAPDHSFKAGCRQAWRSQQTIGIDCALCTAVFKTPSAADRRQPLPEALTLATGSRTAFTAGMRTDEGPITCQPARILALRSCRGSGASQRQQHRRAHGRRGSHAGLPAASAPLLQLGQAI